MRQKLRRNQSKKTSEKRCRDTSFFLFFLLFFSSSLSHCFAGFGSLQTKLGFEVRDDLLEVLPRNLPAHHAGDPGVYGDTSGDTGSIGDAQLVGEFLVGSQSKRALEVGLVEHHRLHLDLSDSLSELLTREQSGSQAEGEARQDGALGTVAEEASLRAPEVLALETIRTLFSAALHATVVLLTSSRELGLASEGLPTSVGVSLALIAAAHVEAADGLLSSLQLALRESGGEHRGHFVAGDVLDEFLLSLVERG